LSWDNPGWVALPARQALRQWITDGGLPGCPLRANEKSFPCGSLFTKVELGGIILLTFPEAAVRCFETP
jgi:hypothetical protein